jgi:hypothetical protein
MELTQTILTPTKMENPISKLANVFGHVYSYSVEFNTIYNQYRVFEYKNGEFENCYGEYKTKEEAIQRRNRILTTGETAITL